MEPKKFPIRLALKVIGWLFAAVVAVFLAIVIRFATGRPTVRVNYSAILNEEFSRASPDDLAWPIYQQALPGFDFDSDRRGDGMPSTREAQPQDPQWNDLVSWLGAHEHELALVREASTKPLLGYYYTANSQAIGGMPQGTAANPLLISILLRHLNPLHEAAKALRADARLAHERRDADRFIADLAAMVGMARQIRGRVLVESLHAMGILGLMLDELDRALADTAFEFTDAQLKSLADAITQPTHADGLLSYDGERMFFADVIQRMYTDDGNGNGRLTLDGIRLMQEVTPAGASNGQSNPARSVTLPFTAASRKQIVDEFNRLTDIVEANLRGPYRNGNWDSYIAGVSQMKESGRFQPIGTLMPSLEATQQKTERYLGRRDALLVAIAVRRHKLQTGTLPESLEKLVPTFLDALPVDRITGESLHYKIVDGMPLIYSIGADRDDDGGRVPVNNAGKPQPETAANFRPKPGNAPDGDWVLFPFPHAKE